MTVAVDEPRRVLVHSAEALRSVKLAARRAARAVKELERVTDVDVFGRFTYRGEEDDGDLGEFLRVALEQNDGQELELVVIAQIGGRDRWQDNGTTQRNRPGS